jgi:hypothetical protein
VDVDNRVALLRSVSMRRWPSAANRGCRRRVPRDIGSAAARRPDRNRAQAAPPARPRTARSVGSPPIQPRDVIGPDDMRVRPAGLVLAMGKHVFRNAVHQGDVIGYVGPLGCVACGRPVVGARSVRLAPEDHAVDAAKCAGEELVECFVAREPIHRAVTILDEAVERDAHLHKKPGHRTPFSGAVSSSSTPCPRREALQLFLLRLIVRRHADAFCLPWR